MIRDLLTAIAFACLCLAHSYVVQQETAIHEQLLVIQLEQDQIHQKTLRDVDLALALFETGVIVGAVLK